jgi:hypothetical protein
MRQLCIVIIWSALSLGITIQVRANTIVVTPGLLSSPQAAISGVTSVDFNGSIPSNFAFQGNAGIVQGSVYDVYKQPLGDDTSYAYVGLGGTIIAMLGNAGVGVNYFGLYWGSGDEYNTLTLTDPQGHQSVWGAGGIQIPGWASLLNNPDSYVEFLDTGDNWVSAVWTSSTAAFEFDNVTFGVINPEPTSVALGAIGFFAMGAGTIWRKPRFGRSANLRQQAASRANKSTANN